MPVSCLLIVAGVERGEALVGEGRGVPRQVGWGGSASPWGHLAEGKLMGVALLSLPCPRHRMG